MNNNKKMNPLLLVILIIIALNILGFVLKLFFQFAGIAIIVLAVYLLWLKFSNKDNTTPKNYDDRKDL